jgi:multiple sugar transport system ATP-binding protein
MQFTLSADNSGRLLIDGADMAQVAPANRGLAMVFQSYALYPHMSVRANLGFALKVARVAKDEIATRVEGVARMLDLDQLLDRKPAALSGGQRQRVAIGRALVRKPRAFLFDEPLSNLDASLRAQMRFEIRRLQQDLGITAVYVTHDQAEAMTMADQIVVFRAGRIEQVGAPLDIYRHPTNQFVAGFIGSPQMNFLTGEHAAQFGATTIGIRPEHLIIVPATPAGALSGTVRTVEYLGCDALVNAQIEDGTKVIARCSADVAARAGESIAFRADTAFIHRFMADGARSNC